MIKLQDIKKYEPYIIEKDIPSIQESVANGILSYEEIVLFYLYRILSNLKQKEIKQVLKTL